MTKSASEFSKLRRLSTAAHERSVGLDTDTESARPGAAFFLFDGDLLLLEYELDSALATPLRGLKDRPAVTDRQMPIGEAGGLRRRPAPQLKLELHVTIAVDGSEFARRVPANASAPCP